MPLAVEQERSVRLVNDVLAGNRMLVMVAARARGRRGARPGRALRSRRGGRGRAHAEGARRHAADPRPRRAAGRASATSWPPSRTWSRASPRRPTSSSPSPELEALHRNVQTTFSRIIEEVPYLPAELQMAVANLDDPAELAHMIAGALRIKTEEKQALLEERDVAKRLRRLSELLARELELVEIGTQDPVAGPIGDGQGSARVLPAPAAQGDPGGAGRGRRDPGRGDRAARAARAGRAARATPGSRPSESCSASSGCRRRRPSTA